MKEKVKTNSKILFNQVKKNSLISVYDDFGIKTQGGIISFGKNGKFREVSAREEIKIVTPLEFANKFRKPLSWANAAVEVLRSKL